MNPKIFHVYILASRKGGALYVGVTDDLRRRIAEHKTDVIEGFTKRYQVHNLVYFEATSDVKSAITREKNNEAWKRKWKIDLIEKENPEWRDLFPELI